MLKTWSFWKTFFTIYLALVGGTQVFADPYISFEGEGLKQILGFSWWVYYYLIPFLIAFLVAALRNKAEKPLNKATEVGKSAAQSNIEVGRDVDGNIIVGHGNIIHRITNYFLGDTKGQLEQRNRRVMLDHVENFWVKGVLEKSLHGVALLELGIKEDPTAVHYPWTIKRESTDESLPPGKSMLEIFREIGMGHSLLILGAPGAGKTTMLLELTRQLVKLAREDESEPLPVVFNLASWTEKLSLADWLAEQLNLVYFVPKRIAPSWVQGNNMLLLLDGLDEVKGDSRTKCVEAVNQFRTQYGLTPLVVCSRIEEYTAIKTKLSLEGAITVQPLTSDQISSYINRFGNNLASLRLLLSKDEVVKELAETPLMLSIMAIAYKDVNANELIALNDIEDQRKHLFNAYIQRMFERPARHISSEFTKQETLHYLNYLARTMIRHNIITYQIEGMQPSWLEERPQRRLYRLCAMLLFGLFFGLLVGLLVGLIGGLSSELLFGLLFGLLVGLLFGLLYGLRSITMVDKLSWSWREAEKGLVGGLVSGLLVVLVAGLSSELQGRLVGGLSRVLVSGLLIGLLAGLFAGLSGGLISEQVEETSYPGQRLKQTLSNSLFVDVSLGLLLGLLLGVSGEMSRDLLLGLLFGQFLGLNRGHLSIILYISLRWVFTRYHLLPYHLYSFLDYSVDLIFLRRVGGSFIFVHRLLMEHFARMELEGKT